jgi:hypothetical protein
MRLRRTVIDAKLDLIAQSMATVRRRSVPALIGIASMVGGLMLWARRRHARRALAARPTPRLLAAG